MEIRKISRRRPRPIVDAYFKIIWLLFIFIVYFLLYDNCIVNLYISYLDLVAVGPHQLYSCSF